MQLLIMWPARGFNNEYKRENILGKNLLTIIPVSYSLEGKGLALYYAHKPIFVLCRWMRGWVIILQEICPQRGSVITDYVF